jgi:hypothetical protein
LTYLLEAAQISAYLPDDIAGDSFEGAMAYVDDMLEAGNIQPIPATLARPWTSEEDVPGADELLCDVPSAVTAAVAADENVEDDPVVVTAKGVPDEDGEDDTIVVPRNARLALPLTTAATTTATATVSKPHHENAPTCPLSQRGIQHGTGSTTMIRARQLWKAQCMRCKR